MKQILHKYNASKYRRFMGGMLFAAITVAALILCIADISNYTASRTEILFPFFIAVISMLMGFKAMFGVNGYPGEKA